MTITTTQQRRLRLPPAEREARLIDTAINISALFGFGSKKVNHGAIAKLVGDRCSVATVFNYFDSAETLHQRIIEEAVKRLCAQDEEREEQEQDRAHVTVCAQCLFIEPATLKRELLKHTTDIEPIISRLINHLLNCAKSAVLEA